MLSNIHTVLRELSTDFKSKADLKSEPSLFKLKKSLDPAASGLALTLNIDSIASNSKFYYSYVPSLEQAMKALRQEAITLFNGPNPKKVFLCFLFEIQL